MPVSMASTLQHCRKRIMIEKQTIKGKDVWLKVDQYLIQLSESNDNDNATEYFTASYYLQEPPSDVAGETIKDENGEPKLFESPVAALAFVRKQVERAL
jgi:hypothetical protein